MRLAKGIAGGLCFVAAVMCGAVLGYWLISVWLLLIAAGLIRSSQAT